MVEYSSLLITTAIDAVQHSDLQLSDRVDLEEGEEMVTGLLKFTCLGRALAQTFLKMPRLSPL